MNEREPQEPINPEEMTPEQKDVLAKASKIVKEVKKRNDALERGIGHFSIEHKKQRKKEILGKKIPEKKAEKILREKIKKALPPQEGRPTELNQESKPKPKYFSLD